MEHARGAWHRHRARHLRRRCRLRPVLSGRTRIPSRSRTYPDADVSETVRCRTSDDFPDADPGTVLVDAPGPGSVDRGIGNAGAGDPDRRLWALYDATWMGLGGVRLGLCVGVVPRERPHKIARIPNS